MEKGDVSENENEIIFFKYNKGMKLHSYMEGSRSVTIK